MKNLKIALVVSLFSLLFSSSAMAVTITKISGYIGYVNSYNTYAWGASVKACLDPTGRDLNSCRGGVTNMDGYYQWNGNWTISNNATLYFFAWVDGGPGGRQGRWGAQYDIICGTATAFSTISRTYFLGPAPLKVSAIYPTNYATNVPLQITLKWTNASDVHRQYWATSYDIYASGYAAPMLLQIADLPCNPDANGYCQWVVPISLDPQTPYNWQVVAKNTTTYTTPSDIFHFTSGY